MVKQNKMVDRGFSEKSKVIEPLEYGEYWDYIVRNYLTCRCKSLYEIKERKNRGEFNEFITTECPSCDSKNNIMVLNKAGFDEINNFIRDFMSGDERNLLGRIWRLGCLFEGYEKYNMGELWKKTSDSLSDLMRFSKFVSFQCVWREDHKDA